MGWQAPRDWTGISGGIVTANQLNVDLRDNLNVLSTHTHTGAAGFGSSTLSGVTLAALTTLTFADQSADPDAAGELQRNGNDLLYYNGSAVVNVTQADAAADTASLRTLGTTSAKAAAGNHTHTLRQQASTRKDYSDGDSGTDIGTDSGVQVDVIERSISMASTVNALVITVTFNLSACVAGASVRLAIEEEEGTPSELVTETVTTSDPGTYANMQLHTLHALYLPASTSSITYAGSASPQNAGANSKTVWGTIQISEVTIIPA
tara:strand:- start:41 stop:832 length:792 start_codon:yes stop_codon:yes gene_type:complete